MDRHRDELLYSLQIGRALAAIGVIIYHSALAIHIAYPYIPDHYFKLFSLGHLGVDYFFVLSGFIIAHSARRILPTREGARAYFTARFIRVYVPYLPVALLMIAVFALIPSITLGTRDHYSLFASFTLLPSDGRPALSVAWTLQHEVLFYLLFGLCLFVFKRPMLIFLWALPILGLLVMSAERWQLIAAGTINLEFLFGVAACYLYHQGTLFKARYVLVAIGASLVFTACFFLFNLESFAQYRILAGLGYGFVVLGFVLMEKEYNFGRFKTFVYFGTISYSIYLIHGPVISVLLRLAPHVPMHWFIAFLIFCALSCIAGMVYYRVIEKPLIRWVKRRLGFNHRSAVDTV